VSTSGTSWCTETANDTSSFVALEQETSAPWEGMAQAESRIQILQNEVTGVSLYLWVKNSDPDQWLLVARRRV
jgi:hypothetical protein